MRSSEQLQVGVGTEERGELPGLSGVIVLCAQRQARLLKTQGFVSCANNNDLTASIHTIHESQTRGYKRRVDLTLL